MKPPSGRHIFIATPAHSGQVVCEYAKSLVDTIPALLANGIAYTHAFCMGNALVHDARNRMVGWFMASPATDLLFIDADISWDAADAVRLAMSPHDVIGGAYRQKRDDAEMYNVANIRPTGTALLDCDYLGTGFLKISRKAIEKLQKAHPETSYMDPEGKRVHALFQAPIEGGRITGEDAFFCRLWRAAGGKVFFDPGMTLWHVGAKAWRGNFAELAARVQSEKATEAA